MPKATPIGKKNPISRNALRAKTEGADRRALPRAATRIFKSILPGVAARRPSSKAVK